jgi:ubiquinone biosynthesis protein COQ9
MKRSTLLRIALLSMTVLAIQNTDAGSAVATDGYGHNIYSYGHPKEIAKQRALDMARREGWVNVRIVAATDIVGYGTIAVALHPNGQGSILGVALGKRSATEADNVAIEQCLKAGGTHPKIRWRWHG